MLRRAEMVDEGAAASKITEVVLRARASDVHIGVHTQFNARAPPAA